MKIVINCCYGGFNLSAQAQKVMEALGFKNARDDSPPFRSHPKLVEMVEQDAAGTGGPYSELKIVEVPDDVKWHIHEYDGMERVDEDHRTWCTE